DPGYDALDVAWFFVRELGVGALVGVAVGGVAVYGLRRFDHAQPGLALVTSFATAAVAFGAAGAVQGSGFLAAYLAGLALGSAEFFNILFFAVLVSTLVQGATVEPLARRLGLAQGRARPAGFEPATSASGGQRSIH